MTERERLERKKKGRGAGIISGVIVFAGVNTVVGWVPLLGPLAAVVAGAIVGVVVSNAVQGAGTSANNPAEAQRAAEEAARKAASEMVARRKAAEEAARAKLENIPLTGNEAADKVITQGIDMIRQIREVNAAIPDETLTAGMDSLTDHCAKIFRTVSSKPDTAPHVRKFMSYYLPTTLKMLSSYRMMLERGVSREETDKVYYDLCHALNMVDTACAKQLDSLYQDNVLDISTDVEVLEQMLRRDGLTDGSDAAPILKTGKIAARPAAQKAATAAAAQLRRDDASIMESTYAQDTKPAMEVPDNSNRSSNIHL